MKMWESVLVAPFILNLGAGWRWAVNFVSRTMCLRGESPWCLSNRRPE